jgi:hypothetical protein
MTDPTPDLAMSSDRLIELQERADEGKPFSPIAAGQLLTEIARLKARTCPHVVTGDGGISHCALASEIVGKAIAKLDTSHARIEELEAERDKLQDRLAVLVVAVRAGRPDR